MDSNDLKRVIEALIFAADAPLTPERIRETLETCSDEELAQTVETLNSEYAASGHAFMIRHVAGGYQVTTRPQFSNWIKKLYLGRQKTRLSQAALESLAIIAFKQPISRVDIAQIRGVNSDAVIGTLLERKLVTISGRSEAVGRPLLYSTTPEFMEFFGINDLAELPKPREIEELIGKEGMPEEVLQALSSDKQLKLPISFEPEAAVENINLPLLMPVATEAAAEQAEATVLENVITEEPAALMEKSDEPVLSSAADAADSADFEQKAETAPFVPEEVPNEAAASTSDELAEDFFASSVVGEDSQSEEEPSTIGLQEEATSLDTVSESPVSVEAAMPEAVLPQLEAEMPAPAVPQKKKERKRGKRATTIVDDVDGRMDAVTPQAESEALAVETPAEDFVAEEESASQASDLAGEVVEGATEASNSEAPAEADSSETQAAPALEALPATELELDVVAIAEDVLEPDPEEQSFAVSEVEPVTEPVVVENSATENLKIAVPLHEETTMDSLPELSEPQVVEVSHDEAATIVVPAIAEGELQELDSWPEVTEVQVEEPVNFSEALAPIALSTNDRDDEATTFIEAATHGFESAPFAPEEPLVVGPVAEFEPALAETLVASEAVMLAASPSNVTEETAPQIIATPENGEQMRAGLTIEEAAVDLARRESEATYEEEPRFFV
ncbi:SMC-Scp complex subunit ScpB [candidate division KSB1 bacterium]|nr:SMC-Scp complex subunit ScpB [candidate division KSB1 bacterium]